MQLWTGNYVFKAFWHQAEVPLVSSPLCSCRWGYQISKHIIIHCHNYSAATHALRDDQGHLLGYKQLVTTAKGFQKVTRGGNEKQILGQYQRARGFLYPPRPSSLANN